MTYIKLPGRCIVCGWDVVWYAKAWRKPTTGHRHRCPLDRPLCGAWMPKARERCARRPGHAVASARTGDNGHRTAYALDNDRRARGSLRQCWGGTMNGATGRKASVANPPPRPVAPLEG